MKITRRDFVNGVLVGSGAALLSANPPSVLASGRPQNLSSKLNSEWYGYGGVGDYASSHGNTPEVINTAHQIRDNAFSSLPNNMPVDEEYDLVIVGGGVAGLGAAWHFKKHAKPGQRCLILDNHPIFGGEAKENVFEVNGERLVGPQGANGFFIPPEVEDPEKASGDARYYAEFNIPRDLSYRAWPSEQKPLKFGYDNYGFTHWMGERGVDIGHYYDSPDGGVWAINIWDSKLRNTPLSERIREGMLSWHNSRSTKPLNEGTKRWLDTMSYKDFLEKELKLGSEGTSYADPFMAGSFGLGCDSMSAYLGAVVNMPGLLSKELYQKASASTSSAYNDPRTQRNSFPGGNSGYARYFLKHIKPEAIAGKHEFEDIITGSIQFDEMDRPGQQIRIRSSATVIDVQHEGPVDKASSVRLIYTCGGKLHRLRAKGVVMASGGWVNKHIVKDLPDEFSNAYSQFYHAPFLVANVALTNWRFLYKLGITGARWYDGGFGYSCNIRPPMMVGDNPAPLDPDKPIILTFYVPFHSPGLPTQVQGVTGRNKLFMTPYSDYEHQIKTQMTKMFGATGFMAEKDISGIILNRWGHAYVVPTPGFFFDTPERKAPRNVIKQGYGRIAFGHSELEGFQHWGPAADQGRRAVEQLLEK